jgi:formylmethanofuran dehydrogenase subunit E
LDKLIQERKLLTRYLTILLLIFLQFATLSPVVLAEPDAAFYDLLQQFHGDNCAGSIFGARLGYAAKHEMGDCGKLTAQYFDLSCPVDGIQLATGATYGNRGLEVLDQDDHRLILTDAESGKKVEARLTEQALEQGRKLREVSNKPRSSDPNSDEAMALQRDKESLLNWLRTAPDSLVVNVQVVK